MVEVSADVARAVADTHLLADKVRRMTTILERETDTALLAISGWGARVPQRFRSA